MTDRELKKKLTGARENSSSGAPGGSALMVIFAILCLAVFSVLALSTVLADARLSGAYEQSVTGYYAAQCESELKLALIRDGELPEGVEKDGDVYIISCDISETEQLVVKVKEESGSYTVISRTVAHTAEWSADSGRDVWSGN